MTIHYFRQRRRSRLGRRVNLKPQGWSGSTGALLRLFGQSSVRHSSGRACHISTPIVCRNTLTRLGGHVCKTAEEYKAWSQNLGHEQVLTTFMSYGTVATERQAEIIREIGFPKPSTQPDVDNIAEALFRRFQRAGTHLATG